MRGVAIYFPIEGTPFFIGDTDTLSRVLISLTDEWQALLARAVFSHLSADELAEIAEAAQLDVDTD